MIGIFLLWTGLALGQDVIQVKSLSQDSCWLKESEEQVLISSYPENLSISLERNQISEFLSEHLSLQERPKSLNSFLHCGAQGHALVFNIQTEDKSFCLWSRFNGESWSEVSQGGSESDGEFCDGYTLQTLLVKRSFEVDEVQVLSRLKSLKKNNVISDFKKLSGNFYKIFLKEKDQYQELKLGRFLSSMDEFESFELEMFFHQVGEFIRIDELSF